MRKFLILAAALLLTACAQPIADFSNRGVVYGWVDIGKVRGNRLSLASIRQFNPPSERPYWTANYAEFQGGYLFWHYGVDTGASYEIDKFETMGCLGVICSNTTNEYRMGPFGQGPGKITVTRPAVYYMGAFKLGMTRRPGLFSTGQFGITKVRGPSRRAMLEYLADNAPADHPEVAARIRAAMR